MLEKVFDEVIQKDTEKDREFLRSLSGHSKMSGGERLVYIYSTVEPEDLINYPKKPGRVVYIGETKRADSPGKRFLMHFARTEKEGLTSNVNHTLTFMYYASRKLRLRVYRLTGNHKTREIEDLFLKAHLHFFAAFPIGQGATGRRNTPQIVKEYLNQNMSLVKEVIASLRS